MVKEDSSAPSETPPTDTSSRPSDETRSGTIRIALYNGTNVQGKTYDMEQVLVGSLENIEIVEKKLAKSTDYAKTRVINLKNIGSDVLETIAKAAGGEIGDMEEGEETPDADILIIIGK
jgi:phosphosulfolactate phosphohydrolase-like enzyme